MPSYSFLKTDIINTIENCISQAKNPESLYFGICFQDEMNNTILDQYKDVVNFEIVHMNWQDAKGPAYARGIIYDLYKDQDYYLSWLGDGEHA